MADANYIEENESASHQVKNLSTFTIKLPPDGGGKKQGYEREIKSKEVDDQKSLQKFTKIKFPSSKGSLSLSISKS